jgi:hypothetical protein
MTYIQTARGCAEEAQVSESASRVAWQPSSLLCSDHCVAFIMASICHPVSHGGAEEWELESCEGIWCRPCVFSWCSERESGIEGTSACITSVLKCMRFIEKIITSAYQALLQSRIRIECTVCVRYKLTMICNCIECPGGVSLGTYL